MPSKLSRYSEGIMEAAWLAAVILVPVFFNVYSSRIFEPDKIATLRTLALIILVAWLVKLIDLGGVSWKERRPEESWLKQLAAYPLMLPVMAVALVYILATIFSVTPAISLWGSYQRLQGTYTTFSYLIIFGAIAANLRKRAQVERLVTTMIVASLPVALYGVLQRYKLDPIPWGGDTSIRIAANMGNSIFVAAYLIMVFPLTVGRIISSFRSILSEAEQVLPHVARATVYVFIAALQVVALYMSGSRGPALGWMTSVFFLALLLTLYWKKRWAAFAIVGLAVAAAGFLFVFNIDSGPLEPLRSSPAIGRFGQLLNAESNSALVRKYIWEGAADLVAPHEPIEFPDGRKDPFNFLRPLIGYGPESMYVAYNPFYPPALGTVEKRNASPDRSHNETWDSLVITGVLGLIAYILIFTAVFYYGLKWLRLIEGRNRKVLFFSLYFGGGLLGAVGLSVWRGVEYAGVGLPFGILLGLVAYLSIAAMFPTGEDTPRTPGEAIRSLTLLVLLSAILAHFVEINFGIAIAATRTYFWVYSALLLVVGYILPSFGEYGEVEVPDEEARAAGAHPSSGSSSRASKKKRRTRGAARSSGYAWPAWWREGLISAYIMTVILAALGYDFISATLGGNTAFDILWNSFSSLRSTTASSYGIMALLATTWIAGGIVVVSEIRSGENNASWLKRLGAVMGISAVLSLFFWLWHAGALASLANSSASTIDEVIRQVSRYEGLLSRFYTFVILLILGAGFLLVKNWPVHAANSGIASMAVAPLLLAAALFIATTTNLRVIQADIAFKMADPFTRRNSWPVAIEIYNHANELAPNEDYYYLFLGRAYLEQARSLEDEAQRDLWIAQAEEDLLKAQRINPLNTDHTANLARLYSLWASFTEDEALKIERARISEHYFEKAVTLSPNNTRLWNEWALLYMNVLQEPGEALDRLNTALEVDPLYDWTYGLLGDYYVRTMPQTGEAGSRQAALEAAAENYAMALEVVDKVRYNEKQNKYSYAVSLAGVYAQLEKPAEAIAAYQESLELAPDGSEKWRIEETIARLYAQQGDAVRASEHAQRALALAPDEQKQRLETFVAQLGAQQ